MQTYTGVYRAKALQVQGGVITAYVPQVFGDQAITITDVIGGLPDGPTLGWVLFESGWPEFPVWTSGVVTGSIPVDVTGLNEVEINTEEPETPGIELWYDPEGGYGAPTVPTGVNEVAVSTVAPVDPGIELWFDPDAIAPSIAIPTGGATGDVLAKTSPTDYELGWVSRPLGVLAYGQRTTSAGPDPFASLTRLDATLLQRTVTVGAGRMLKITGHASAIIGTVASDRFSLCIIEGTTTKLQQSFQRIPATAIGLNCSPVVAIITPTAGAHTYALAAERVGGTGNATFEAAADRPLYILIEDMGPAV